MLNQQLQQLIEHWRALAAEAKQQGEDARQSPLLRGHAFGISDGLEIAAGNLEKILSANSEPDQTRSE
jgi:hypothetical protein